MKTKFLLKCLVMVLAMSSLACVKGEQGERGAPGPVGSSGKIISTINCLGTVSGLTGFAGTSLNGLGVEYNAVLTQGGDVYATAAIIDDFTQVSGTSFYAAGQNGAATASVLITADFDSTGDGGFWEISLDRQSLVTTAVYEDDSLFPDTPVTMTFAPSACSIMNF